jgi:polyferredoxin
MIAFTVFMIMVIAANKFICSWGCQFGTLQDFVFRLNRNRRDTGALTSQYKIPFIVSNTVRVLFLLLFTAAAFIWSIDLFHNIDPFKIFKPSVLSPIGIAFIASILILSLFIYRPWCHFFCPFGLAGWVGEKISLFKIKVDYNTCIECNACSKACPSYVMDAILKRDKIIPDCYSCSTCINVCPTGSISFTPGKRPVPPAGKFEKNKKA